MTGAEAAEVIGLGACAAAFGTAFLSCPEAGTAEVHRHALTHRRARSSPAPSRVAAPARCAPRGRTATGNAPAAYPHVHHVTAPLRAHGKALGEADLVHLWAGTGHGQARARRRAISAARCSTGWPTRRAGPPREMTAKDVASVR